MNKSPARASRTRSLIAPALAFVAMTGCGGNPPLLYGDSPQTASPTTTTPPDMAQPVAYPVGPYGNKKDEVLADITIEGYRLGPAQTDATKLMWDTSIKLSDIHANPACKCLVISTGATWCGACNQEQPKLISDVMSDPSFCVLGVLQEGPNNGTAATKEDVNAWTAMYSQNFYTGMGTAQTKGLWQGWDMNGTIGLPFNLIVEPKTMKVVGNIQGFDPAIHDKAMMLCGQ